MVNDVIVVGDEFAIAISVDSKIRLMQSIDCGNGDQVYVFKGMSRDDLWVLKRAITQALELTK
jgi:hypothetical protein